MASRDPSADKIPKKLNNSGKISRQPSKERVRSESRISDHSSALPDLEIDETIIPDTEDLEIDANPNKQRTQSLIISRAEEVKIPMKDSTAEKVLKDMDEHHRH